ncbi:cyanophycinase [Nibribacter ruber]|uniref:Cyanophycinase n=1 Tax=Nibribacter ruber TaxID=2698458 RepID=A0A6P1NR61_9BACT|nr:cyanophycinase [Nibribacter ruber]QHL86167.1 cyanophycinase [Nibribacter ruber]
MTVKARKQKELEQAPVEYKTPNGTLIAIGGAENKGDETHEEIKNHNFVKNEILQRFVDELKKEDPMVVVIPSASETPEVVGQEYVRVFKKLKVRNVKVLHLASREESNLERHLMLVKKADGIMFTGGDQLRLTAIFGGTEVMRLIKDRYYNERLVIAGTSAGAAAMSTQMIFQGQSEGFIKGAVSITAGLELLNDAAIDTHFIARGRIVRMVQMIATNPTFIGIGLEEDTGVVVKKGRNLEVIGSGLVTIVDGRKSTYTNIYEIEEGAPVTMRDLRVHLLGKGDTYTLEIF